MTENFYDSRAWLELRYQRLKISGGHCVACGVRATEENPIHVDHIKPRSTHQHLELSLDNTQVMCRKCNLGKSNKDETDWRWVPLVDEIALVAAFDLSDLQRQVRRELLERSIKGSTKEERQAARKLLDSIAAFAADSFASRKQAAGDEQ